MRNPRVVLSMLGLAGTIHAVVVDDYHSFCGCIILKSLNNTENASVVGRYMETITITSNDRLQCNNWNAFPEDAITLFPDSDGRPTNDLLKAVGIFYQDAYRFCGSPSVKQKFLPQNFASSTVGLLLPYIALCTQLGMQTGSILGDLLSILFSLGSPVWICSSIAHSVLFRRAIHKRLEKLRVDAISNQSGHDVAPFIEQCDAAETILQSFLQAPIRLSTRPGFLSSLIVLPQNHGWWPTTAAKIETGHRRIDAPYIGQNMIAVITWLLSILVDFESIPGSIPGNSGSAEWQICMGTLFLWLFIAAYGLIAIKSQYEAGNIGEALRCPWAVGNQFLIPLNLNDGRIAIITHEHQTAIEQRAGLNPLLPKKQKKFCPRESEAQINMDDIEARRNTSVTTTLGCIVGGDEGRQGPIYFCARIFTSWWASEQIIKALQQQLENNKPPISVEIEFKVDVFGKDRSKDQTKTEKVQTTELTELRGIGSKESHAAGPKEAGPEAPEKDINVEAATRTQGKIEDSPREEDSGITAEVLDSSLNIEPAKITAYPEWGQINAIQWITFVLGYIFGLLVVWCTCGPALFVLYTTPPVGLGCLSGGILIYAFLATVSSFFVFAGILLSHQSMLEYQRYHLEHPKHRLSTSIPGTIGRYTRTTSHSLLCGAAVIANGLGKVIAVANACWVLSWSLIAYSNVMDNPYCTTAYYSLRNLGWVRLWDFSADQFKLVALQELGSLSAASVVAVCACILIYNLTSERRSPRNRWRVTAFLLAGFVVLVTVLTYLGARNIKGRRGTA